MRSSSTRHTFRQLSRIQEPDETEAAEGRRPPPVRGVLIGAGAILVGAAVAARILDLIPGRTGFVAAITGAAGAGGLAALAIAWLLWPPDRPPGTRMRRIGPFLLLAGTLAITRWSDRTSPEIPESAWVGNAGTGLVGLTRFEANPQWGIARTGFELHASAPGGFPGTWRATARLPRLIQLTGGRVVVHVTQPEFAVFDSAGNVNAGGDGVLVGLIASRGNTVTRRHRAEFNLHAHPDERRWHRVSMGIPRGSRRLSLEVSPGSPGSNDWFDRVWISVDQMVSVAHAGLALGEGMTLALVLWGIGSAAIAGLRPPYRGWRGARALATVNGVVILTGLVAVELWMRQSGISPYTRTYPLQDPDLPAPDTWLRPDPRFGWVANHQHGDPAIDRYGFRNPAVESETEESAGCPVLFLGDSFTYGAGIPALENIPSQLVRQLGPRYRSVNLAMPGWGIDQMFLAYRAFVNEVDPGIVVLAYIDDDIPRVLEAFRSWEGVNKPSFEVRDGQLVPREPIGTGGRLANFLAGQSRLISSALWGFYLRSDAGPIVEHVVHTIAQESKQGRRRFVVVRIPTLKDFPAPVRRWLVNVEKMARSAGVSFLDLGSGFTNLPGGAERYYLPNGHLTPEGSAIIARRLAQLLTSSGMREVWRLGGSAPQGPVPAGCGTPLAPSS